MSAVAFGSLADVKGGGGADTIDFNGATILSGQIFGGLGADSINLNSAIISGGSLAYETLTESTLSFLDTVIITGGVLGATSGGIQSGVRDSGALSFSLSAVSLTLTTGLAAGAEFSGVVTDGFLASGHFTQQGGTAGGVTARATLLDGQSNTLGEVFVFEDGSDNAYLFVQG